MAASRPTHRDVDPSSSSDPTECAHVAQLSDLGFNETATRERETIVFLLDGDRIFAVYEGRSIPGMHILTNCLAAYCF
jgi:hypothetical protein